MSGEVYCPGGLELLNLDFSSTHISSDGNNLESSLLSNPLHCLLCRDSLVEPIVLTCFHVFCRQCVLKRRDQSHNADENSTIKCPLCGTNCDASDSNLISDRIVKYFINSANEKTDLCANCDRVNQPMYFCETCQQPLCNMCKDQTHQAKMFSSHRVVAHDERSGRATTKLCKKHEEPYILFSTDTKSLGCIMCFRKASAEIRSHFVDLENAHRSGVDKMEKVAKQLKTFQKDVRDGVLLHRSLLDEVRKSANAETCQIQVLCQQMIDRLMEIRDQLSSSINKECAEREEHFRQQLNSLCALVPTVQLNLLIASILCSSANKLDFLDLAYPLIQRIQTLMNEHHQNITPAYTAQIQTNYKAEFARALEPFLGMKSVLLPTVISRQLSSSAASSSTITTSTSCCPPDPVFISTSTNSGPGAVAAGASSGGELSPCGSVHSLQYSANGSNNRTKRNSSYSHFHRLKLMIDLAGAFGDEYNKIDGKLKQLQKRFGTVSRSAQEVQRDMTIRRCLVDDKRLSDVLGQCQRLKIDVGVHSTQVDELQPIFQHIWEEQLDRVRIQQETYKNHIGNILTLREDLHRVITATEQLEPFIRSLTQVIQQIKPELCPCKDFPDPKVVQQIVLQINTLEPNSEMRVNAIERQQQQRKEELERKKLENSNMLVELKRQLKSAPVKPGSHQQDHQHQHQSNNGEGPVLGSLPTVPIVVVKGVDRERSTTASSSNELSSSVLQEALSPGGAAAGTITSGTSPKPHHKRGSTANCSGSGNGGSELQVKLRASSASLDESFELLLTSMDRAPLQLKKAGTTKCGSAASANGGASGRQDLLEVAAGAGSQTTLSVVVPNNCGDSVGGEEKSNISHSLPSLVVNIDDDDDSSTFSKKKKLEDDQMEGATTEEVEQWQKKGKEEEVQCCEKKGEVEDLKTEDDGIVEVEESQPQKEEDQPCRKKSGGEVVQEFQKEEETKIIECCKKEEEDTSERIEAEKVVVPPPPPMLPADLIASVKASTLEARGRMLASLKEKVKRIDVGPGSADHYDDDDQGPVDPS